MGLMQGKVVGNALVIVDSFALPVQGTETRVNAQNEANEYMVSYISESESVRTSYPTALWIDQSEALVYRLGRKTRTCYRMVSLAPRIWVLALRY